MARIEKTVFISYRRTDVYTALAVYENLKNQEYDVFFDYRSISSGDFEQIITGNIRARAHFLIILTPTALDRCNEPGDWLRHEIEYAIDQRRNIVPLFFKGFRFGISSNSGISKWLGVGKPNVLTGKLKDLSRYNGLNVHEDYFEEAMVRLRTEYLNKPLDTVLHPISTEVQKVVEEEKSAADEALKHKEDTKEPVKQIEEKPGKQAELETLKSQAIRLELRGEFWEALQFYYKIKKIDPAFPRVDVKIRELEEELQPKPDAVQAREIETEWLSWKSVSWRLLAGMLILFLFLVWGWASFIRNLSTSNPQLTRIPSSTVTATAEPVTTSTPILGIGSAMTSEDGMTQLYVPAGEFTMGSDNGESDEKPVHTVYLDAFWVDQTEVTNAMYAKCVDADICNPPSSVKSYTRDSYYGNSQFDDYPVIYISWVDARAYCSWAGRRLPSEAEWEKAARGTDQRIYPWGNDSPTNTLLNYNSAVGDTTEVGKYPDGASPYGALDMAGNVWEWVEDWYDAYPGNSESNSAYSPLYQVLRGGSLVSDNNGVRSANRRRFYGYVPTSTLSYMGFRCAMSATP